MRYSVPLAIFAICAFSAVNAAASNTTDSSYKPFAANMGEGPPRKLSDEEGKAVAKALTVILKILDQIVDVGLNESVTQPKRILSERRGRTLAKALTVILKQLDQIFGVILDEYIIEPKQLRFKGLLSIVSRFDQGNETVVKAAP